MGKSMKLVELKVIQLKNELANRGFEKNGTKAILVDRLKKALEKEGHDPLLFEFNVTDDGNESLPSEDDSFLKDAGESNQSNVENSKEGSPGSSLVANDSVLSLSSLSSVPPPPPDGILTVQDVIDLKSSVKPLDDYSVIVQLDETESLKLDGVPESTTKEEKNETSSNRDFKIEAKENGERPSESEKKETDKKDLSDSANLWVTNINDSVSAVDLKQLFAEHGKVISAKIVVNAKTDPPKRFGYLQMSSSTEADLCIQKLTDYHLDGQTIQIKKAKGEPSASKKSEKVKSELKKKEEVKEELVKSKNSFSEPAATIKKLEKKPMRNYRTLKSSQLTPSKSTRSYAEILAAKKKANYGIRGGGGGLSLMQRKPNSGREHYSRVERRAPDRPMPMNRESRPLTYQSMSYTSSMANRYRSSMHSGSSVRGGAYNSNPQFNSMRLKQFKNMGFTDRDAFYALKRESFMQSNSIVPARQYHRDLAHSSSSMSNYPSPQKKPFHYHEPPVHRETSRPSYKYEEKYPYNRERNYSSPRFNRLNDVYNYDSKQYPRQYPYEKPTMSNYMSHAKESHYSTQASAKNHSFPGVYSQQQQRYSRPSSAASYQSQPRSNYPTSSHSRNIPRSMDFTQRDYKKRYRTHPYMDH